MATLKRLISNLLFWKLYFWFSLGSLLIASLFLIIGSRIGLAKFNAFDWSIYTSEVISIIGLYSFTFKKKILSPKFWLFLFWYILISWNLIILYGFLLDKQILNFLDQFSGFFIQPDWHPALMKTLFNFLLQIPTFYAIYKLSRLKV